MCVDERGGGGPVVPKRGETPLITYAPRGRGV